MLLFHRIFKFEKAKVAQMAEQRLNQRYAPGAAFPLQAAVELDGRTWPAKVLNLSGNGVGLAVPGAGLAAKAGQDCVVTLTLGMHRQTIPGRVAHTRAHGRDLQAGIGLRFGDFLVQKAYLQLLQPVAIGQSLRAVPADRVIQNETQVIKQVFRGDYEAVLTVWLEKTFGTPLHSFEFQLHDYFCRADVKAGVLDAYAREEAESFKGKLTNPVFDAAGDLQDEIRQLIRWILPNLTPAVPDDVRAFLQRFAG